LRKRFKPRVLDRYPATDEDRPYYPFPGNDLSLFCFPQGIQLTTAQRGVPAHFNFILTEAAGSRIYGSVLVFDETLSTEMKNRVREKGCVYNVNLDQIYTQKAICILSHYGFLDSFKEVLKQIYRIHLSHTPIPIERYIINIMEEIPVPDKSGHIQIIHDMGDQQISFVRVVDQYPPYASRADIENLFRALSAEHVVDIFLALLAEKKVLLISKYKALLSNACVAFMSFLFPFLWKHVLIPILPRSMIDVLDAPVPFLIGADPSIFNSNPLSDDTIETGYEDSYATVEIPSEVYRVNLDMGLMVEDKKLKHKAVAQLKSRLKKATDHFERPDPYLHMVDQAFHVVSYQEDEYGNEDGSNRPFRFNEYEVRDAFLEFMQTIMANYTLHLVTHNLFS